MIFHGRNLVEITKIKESSTNPSCFKVTIDIDIIEIKRCDLENLNISHKKIDLRLSNKWTRKVEKEKII